MTASETAKWAKRKYKTLEALRDEFEEAYDGVYDPNDQLGEISAHLVEALADLRNIIGDAVVASNDAYWIERATT